MSIGRELISSINIDLTKVKIESWVSVPQSIQQLKTDLDDRTGFLSGFFGGMGCKL